MSSSLIIFLPMRF